MMTTRHPLATAWLERVAALAADLPPAARSELVADLREHLDEALDGVDDPDAVARVLDRLGDPADVVAAAREAGGAGPSPGPVADAPPTVTPGAAPDHLTGAEGVALGLLVLVGLLGLVAMSLLGVLVAVPLLLVLWGVALVLAVVAGRWTGGEVLGLAVLPVGWSLPVWSFVAPVSVTQCVTDASGVETCTGGGGSPWALALVLGVLVLVVLATRWLARAPRGRPARR